MSRAGRTRFARRRTDRTIIGPSHRETAMRPAPAPRPVRPPRTALCALAAALALAASGALAEAPRPADARYKLVLPDPGAYKLAAARDAGKVRDRAAYRLRPPWGPVDPYANPRLAGKPYHVQVNAAARAHELDPALVHAVIAAESNYDPKAISHRGAIGLMQVMPGTGRRYGQPDKALFAPEKNIGVGVRYLAELLALFEGDLELALAGYNAGENAVLRHGRKVPPFAETRAYVPRVLRHYERLAPRRVEG